MKPAYWWVIGGAFAGLLVAFMRAIFSGVCGNLIYCLGFTLGLSTESVVVGAVVGAIVAAVRSRSSGISK